MRDIGDSRCIKSRCCVYVYQGPPPILYPVNTLLWRSSYNFYPFRVQVREQASKRFTHCGKHGRCDGFSDQCVDDDAAENDHHARHAWAVHQWRYAGAIDFKKVTIGSVCLTGDMNASEITSPSTMVFGNAIPISCQFPPQWKTVLSRHQESASLYHAMMFGIPLIVNCSESCCD